MIQAPKYFKIYELVCPHVFAKYAERAWQFFDPRFLITIDVLREKFGVPMMANNWHDNGQFTQRGLRCTQCEMIRNAVEKNELYLSAHLMGRAGDFDVSGMTAGEAREWIVKNANLLPYHVRLEDAVSWLHIDTVDYSDDKVYIFRAS
jgi:hypothetical protein